MTKQTSRNNEFLKHVKSTYNVPTFKTVTKLVNDGKQDLAAFALETQLHWYEGGHDVAEKLIEMKYKYNGTETVSELFEIVQGK